MKKNTSASSHSGSTQNTSQETLRSVVTQLQASIPSAAQTQEPDINLDELRAAIDELPDLNATKVVALHRCIVNGDYKIDSERLAGKLIELEASLDRD